MLERLIKTGEPSSIDLRRTALAPQDFETLNTVLGYGEVSATVASVLLTHIREFFIPMIIGLQFECHSERSEGLSLRE